MTSDELKHELEWHYNVLCLVDLAEISADPSRIYQILTEHYKEEYHPDERLVFYTGHTPTTRLLGSVYHALLAVDISPNFALICCPNYPVHYDMDYFLCSPESADLPDPVLLPTTICPLPWMHLEISNNGAVRPCCAYEGVIGSVLTTPINDVFNNDTMTNLRADMLAGNKPKECRHCWDNERHGVTSLRQRHNAQYDVQFKSTWVNDPTIRSLDLNAGIVCNFKCRICAPESSSLWAAEELADTKDVIRINRLKEIVREGQWFDDNQKFVEQVISMLPVLENLDIYGGEPFLLKNLPGLLERAVATGDAKHIRLHFNSNGSIFPERLIPLFNEFMDVDIALSIDDIGERFEYQRGGAWSDIEANIDRYRAAGIDVYIYPTINVQNIYYVDELYAWAESKDLRFTLNVLKYPNYLSIDYLTPQAQRLLVKKYISHDVAELRVLGERVLNSTIYDGKEFCQMMLDLDKRRGQDFSKAHKEIAIAMNYSVQ
jgi:MoaA/NifB/PqqE/SkfB family radical SAM enzyme